MPCWVIEPIETLSTVVKPKQMDIKCYHGNPTGVTGPEGVTGELVFVDKAFDEDFKDRHLTGKVALTWQEQYWEAGDKRGRKLLRPSGCARARVHR